MLICRKIRKYNVFLLQTRNYVIVDKLGAWVVQVWSDEDIKFFWWGEVCNEVKFIRSTLTKTVLETPNGQWHPVRLLNSTTSINSITLVKFGLGW